MLLKVLLAALVACALQDFPTVENSVNKAAAVTGLLAVCDRFPKLCDNIIRPANTKRARAMFGPEGGTVFELYAREAGLASSPAGAWCLVDDVDHSCCGRQTAHPLILRRVGG